MDEAVLGMVFFSPYNTRNIHTAAKNIGEDSEPF